MFLSDRQRKILNYLIEHPDKYITTNTLADVYSVSNRTIKNDLLAIKQFAQDCISFTLTSERGKGISLSILNKNQLFREFQDKLSFHPHNDKEENLELNILKYLVTHKHHTTKQNIMDTFYISESSFYKIYKHLKELVKPFQLEIAYSKYKEYYIKGNEKDIRSFIAYYDLFHYRHDLFSEMHNFNSIHNDIVDVFIQYQYKITETTLQNISFHVLLMLNRIKHGNYLTSVQHDNLENCIEYKIASHICHKYSKHFLEQPYLNNEIILLTQTILGKVKPPIDENFQNNIICFVNTCFHQISKKFSISFESLDNLKSFLGLHIAQMIYRIQSGTQLKNHMKKEIELLFPPMHDIALYFAMQFEKKYNLTISSDELSYITLYFNYGMQELDLAHTAKKILIITTHRPSELILLKHKILSWFPNQIFDIDIVDPSSSIEELDTYDAVFATALYKKEYENTLTLIHIFPTEDDYKKINIAINGYNNISFILDKFHEKCFFKGHVKNKQELLQILCNNASYIYKTDDYFYEHLLSREEIGSTYFNNSVALPHPFMPMSEETFISVGILEEPLIWDGNLKVELVMLISIEKNNPKAFQLWHYLSEIVKNEQYIKELIQQPDFISFLSKMKTILSMNKNFTTT